MVVSSPAAVTDAGVEVLTPGGFDAGARILLARGYR